MTDLVLVRHGETTWHAENRYAGTSDVPLTATGHRQAAHLATWARHGELSAVWSSPLSRARDTASPAALATGLPLNDDARLRELDFGAAEGLTAEEMELKFPGRFTAFRADPVAHPLPHGEDPREAGERATSCLLDIARTHPDQRVLVVAHTTLLRLALCGFLGIPASGYRQVFPSLRNVALNEIRLVGERASLLQLNSPLEGSL